jgi:putative ABC transport system permease protein
MAGAVFGVAVGAGVQRMFPLLLSKYFQFERGVSWSPAFALEGVGAGLLVTLLFTLPPLLSIRQIRPALIFRREMPETKPGWRERLRTQWPAALCGLLILCGLGAIAGWLAESAKMGAMFIGGLAVSLLVLAGVAWLLLRGLRAFVRSAPVKLPVEARQGIANLYRPGNHAGAILVSLGIGVMFTLTIYLIQNSLLREVAGAAPPNSPNVFLINVTQREYEGVRQLLDSQKGMAEKPRLVPLVAVRLTAIDGKPVKAEELKGFNRRFAMTRQMTWSAEMPADLQIRKGQWWANDSADPLVAISEEAADALKIGPGALLRWNVTGREFDARVAAVYRVQSVGPGNFSEMIFNRKALDGFPTQYLGTARLAPAAVSALQRDAYRKYPTVTVINAADVISIIQEVVDQVSLVVRFISAFAILAGAIILAATVAGTRLRRIRESAVLKTIGARRRRLVGIFSVEFLILGGVAGLMGGALATIFTRVLLTRLLDAPFRMELLPNLVTVILTALLATGAGWLASLRVLNQKPLEVLRDE